MNNRTSASRLSLKSSLNVVQVKMQEEEEEVNKMMNKKENEKQINKDFCKVERREQMKRYKMDTVNK